MTLRDSWSKLQGGTGLREIGIMLALDLMPDLFHDVIRRACAKGAANAVFRSRSDH